MIGEVGPNSMISPTKEFQGPFLGLVSLEPLSAQHLHN